jgi:DeoR family transcriptional regulator of aga operon
LSGQAFRLEKIKEYVIEKEIVSMKELQNLCPEVTSMTLHRDLDVLQKDGLIVKVWGGAQIASHLSESSFANRERENIAAKKLIAGKSLMLIQPDMSIFFDAGTTSLLLVRALHNINITIFTTGANFASDLQRLSNASINLCCGNLNRSNMALSGHSTLEFLEHINIDMCFIGVSGYSDDTGFTCGKESEMLVKKLVIKKARTPVALMDSSKLAKIMPYTFASLEDFCYVITDQNIPESFRKHASDVDVKVL